VSLNARPNCLFRPSRFAAAVATAAVVSGLFGSTVQAASVTTSTPPGSPPSGTSGSTSVIGNGCLVDSTLSGGNVTVPPGSTNITDWVIGNAGVTAAPSEGNNPSPGCPSSTWLYGPDTPQGNHGSVSQSVTSKPGATYALQWYAGNGANADRLYVSWNGTLVDTMTPPTSGAHISWTLGQVLVTATSAKSVLSFSSSDATGYEVAVGSVSLSLAPVVNGFVATGLAGLYGVAEKQMLEKTPEQTVVKVAGTPVCVLQAASATQAKGSTGLQIAWTIAPTSRFIHETTTARQAAAAIVYRDFVNLSMSTRNAYLAALKAGKAALQTQRMPVPSGNGLANSWTVELQSVSTSGKAMSFQITSTGAATRTTWVNIPSATSTDQSGAPLALANLLYYTKNIATS
jgi:hypothetical protein